MSFKSFCLAFTFLSSVMINASAFADDQLVFAIDVIRHGDRTPISTLPLAPHDWKEGLGQLTPQGMHQEYELGASKRKVYIDQYHLLPAHYQPSSLYVRSSDFDRTLMSAESFLMGLYPLGTGSTLPGAYQPIPVHTVPADHETLLVPSAATYHFHDIAEKYVFTTPEWQAKTKALQPKFAAWQKATGANITYLDDLIAVADTLYINQLYQVPRPKALSAADQKEIIAAGNDAFASEYKNPTIGKITGQLLLQTIADNLKQASEKPSDLKYILFSAHDSTLLAELSALGAPLDGTPPYASNLNFQLFKTPEKNYYVKVFFNNKPVTIPGCAKTSCTLSQLSAIANR